eukprot:6051128-Amphidinium_carterae.1
MAEYFSARCHPSLPQKEHRVLTEMTAADHCSAAPGIVTSLCTDFVWWLFGERSSKKKCTEEIVHKGMFPETEFPK